MGESGFVTLETPLDSRIDKAPQYLPGFIGARWSVGVIFLIFGTVSFSAGFQFAVREPSFQLWLRLNHMLSDDVAARLLICQDRGRHKQVADAAP